MTSKARSKRDLEERRKKNRRNRRIKRNVYLSFLARSYTHRRIAKLMTFATLYSVNTTISHTHTHTHKSEKMNWQESNVIHFAISPCVTLHPETVANFNLSPILRLYSYSYYTCVPYFGCFNHMRMCLFVHGASIILSHSAHEKY